MLNPKIEEAAAAIEARRPQSIETRAGGLYFGQRLLPQAADDLSAEEGLAVYRSMNNEPAIASSDFILRAMVLESGWSTAAAYDEPMTRGRTKAELKARKDYETSEAIRDYVETMIDRLETPLGLVLWQALEAWGDGHKLFEQVRDFVADDEGQTSIQVVAIKPKPRAAYSLAVTRFMDLIGAVPTKGGALMIDYTPKKDGVGLVPPEDLFIFSLRGEDGDPRGQAAKRSAYDAWRRKQLAKPEALLHMQLFGSGRYSVEGPVPKEGEKPMTTVTVGGVAMSFTDYLLGQVQRLANNGIIILPNGWTLHDHNPGQGGAEAFEKTFDRCDREMVMAFLTVTRATQEAQHGSKADSETSAGLLSKLVNWLRSSLCDSIREQIFKPAVRMRFGEDAARRYTPKLVMQTVEREDIAALLTAISTAITAGAITPEQLPYWDRRVGQPERAAQQQDPQKEPQPADPNVPPTPGPAFDDRGAGLQTEYTRHIQRVHDKMASLVHRYAKGEIDTADLQDEFDQILRRGHEESYALGRRLAGDKALARAIDAEAGSAAADLESEFVQNLMAQLREIDQRYFDENGNVRTDALTGRLQSYTGKMRATANDAFVEHSEDGEEFDWQLGPVEHCDDCLYWHSVSPFTKETLSVKPGDGSTACVYNCACKLVRRSDGAQGFERA